MTDCRKCKYDCWAWCPKYEFEPGCGDCERLDKGEYPSYRDVMIGELRKRGIIYAEN